MRHKTSHVSENDSQGDSGGRRRRARGRRLTDENSRICTFLLMEEEEEEEEEEEIAANISTAPPLRVTLRRLSLSVLLLLTKPGPTLESNAPQLFHRRR